MSAYSADTGYIEEPWRRWVINSGSRYWPKRADLIAKLPMMKTQIKFEIKKWRHVSLPDWASDCGVDGKLLVPSDSLIAGEDRGAEWKSYDWCYAAWTYLTGAFERTHEELHGPLYSHAFRLTGAHPELFNRAWVNRIFLFLRRWAAQIASRTEEELFGSLPMPELILTHDVDAINKTPEIRIKQTAFNVWNTLKAISQGDFGRSVQTAVGAGRFVTRAAEFQTLQTIRDLECRVGLRSVFHFYAGPAGWSRRMPSRLLLDPAYDIHAEYLKTEMKRLADGGWTIGLHQSTAAWRDAQAMREERARLKTAAGVDAVCCRQHWLRFSWKETWRAQEEAGLRLDSTLGFNDRPGFRNGAALRVKPWDKERSAAMEIETLPMIFMDSHFYDYQRIDEEQRYRTMKRWIDEVKVVRGQATVNWHTHTITEAYGWGDGYRQLLDLLAS